MSAFRLTKRIKVFRRRSEVNDFEPDNGEGELVYSPWAQVRQLRDAERYYADQVYSNATYRIIVRFEGFEISPENWIEVDGKRYDVAGVKDPTGNGQYLEITAATKNEGVGDTTNR